MRVSGSIAAGILAITMASTAWAADYPMLRGSQYDTPPPQQMSTTTTSGGIDWSGFTIGAHGGLSRTYFDFDNSLQTVAAGPLRQTTLLSETNPPAWIRTRSGEDRGQSFGAILGYNMMLDDVLVGFEGDYTRLGQRHTSGDIIGRRVVTSNSDVNDVTLTSNQTVRLHDYATARVRLGWATGRFLPFVTFGGAAGRFDVTKSVLIDWRVQRAGVGAFSNAFGFPTTATDNKRDAFGYGITAGAGVDFAITSNVFLRGEYQFIRFADVKGATIDVNTVRVAGGVKF